jgi:transposase-like protein
MSGKKYRIKKEIKDQILQRIQNEGISVSQAAEDHGVSTKTIYSWLTKGTSEEPSWSEVKRLKKQNQELMQLVGELTVKLSSSQKKS